MDINKTQLQCRNKIIKWQEAIEVYTPTVRGIVSNNLFKKFSDKKQKGCISNI